MFLARKFYFEADNTFLSRTVRKQLIYYHIRPYKLDLHRIEYTKQYLYVRDVTG